MDKETKQEEKPKIGDIQYVLLDMGISPSLLGFTYLTYAEQLISVNEEYMKQVTKNLYVDVAKAFRTTPASVERCIRHAIAAAWALGNIETSRRYFGNSIKPYRGVPTNSQFITRTYFYLKNEMRELQQL